MFSQYHKPHIDDYFRAITFATRYYNARNMLKAALPAPFKHRSKPENTGSIIAMGEGITQKSLHHKLPEVLHSEIVARTNIFRVERRELRFSNGNEVIHERLVGSENGAVLIVPLLNNNTVLLIREYATGVHRYELALPKGRIEANEPLLEAANREIMEEVGYGANKLHHLTSLTVAPGYLSHSTHIVLAEDLYAERHDGDEPETIEVVPWQLDELPKLLAQKECTEARSIAALFMVREYLAQRTGT